MRIKFLSNLGLHSIKIMMVKSLGINFLVRKDKILSKKLVELETLKNRAR